MTSRSGSRTTCRNGPGEKAGAIIFPNPNAPTGRLLPLEAVERIVAGNPDAVVLVDEAYVDFGGESAVQLVDQYPNLLVVHTFSKSRSLAGLRVGYAIGHPDLIEGLERVRTASTPTRWTAWRWPGRWPRSRTREFFQDSCKKVIATRETLVAQLQQLGFEVLPSGANFVFARHPQRDGAELAAALRARAIIVRHFKAARIDQFLRITIGTDEQCATLVQALGEILAG